MPIIFLMYSSMDQGIVAWIFVSIELLQNTGLLQFTHVYVMILIKAEVPIPVDLLQTQNYQ